MRKDESIRVCKRSDNIGRGRGGKEMNDESVGEVFGQEGVDTERG